MYQLENEVFALRDGERYQLWTERPECGRWIAVMARSVEMPEGPHVPTRVDGAPVEQAAIVAADWSHTSKAWKWLFLSPPTKERIGDLLFDGEAIRDRWYFLVVTDPDATA